MPFQFRKEAIEEDLNSNFPSQGQGNPPLYYSLSEVVVPTYSINNVAEGTSLPENLQTAWDLSTGSADATTGGATFISNPGFWRVDLSAVADNIAGTSGNQAFQITMTDGFTSKTIWRVNQSSSPAGVAFTDSADFVVFLKSGDSLVAQKAFNSYSMRVWYRQIAQVNGTLVNPLGFSAA